MTSIAEPARPPRRRGGVLRTALLLGVLGLMALATPPPWSWLWLLVPATVAVSLLACWRFGARGWLVPAAVVAGTVATLQLLGPWTWWIAAASLSGARRRAWMLLPVLALAAALPWLPPYGGFVAAVERRTIAAWRTYQQEVLATVRQAGVAAEQRGRVERELADWDRALAAGLPRVLPVLLPGMLFVWVAGLTAAGRTLASRLAGGLRWPPLAREPLREWRLPDGVLWVLIAGLALIVSPWPAGMPTAWTLVIDAGLGFCVQGVAVVESLMLARGIPPSIIVLSMVFVLLLAWPAFVLTAAALGLSDVWLDYRRLEAQPDGFEA